jgi:hypothetical protein
LFYKGKRPEVSQQTETSGLLVVHQPHGNRRMR